MGGLIAAGWWGLRELSLGRVTTSALAVGVLIPAGAAVYFGLALLLRVDGLDEVRALFARWQGRAAAADGGDET
jgi:hypothetical protein